MTSFVYFIRCENFVKIGKANDPDARLADLQVGNPIDLELLFSIPGSFRTERKFHQRFAASRHIGEWFRIEGKLMEYIKAELPKLNTRYNKPIRGDDGYVRFPKVGWTKSIAVSAC